MKKSFREPEKAGFFHLRKPLNNAELKSKDKKKIPFEAHQDLTQ